MQQNILAQFLRYLIAAVWFANGLFCKVLDLVPRHRQIVAHILGEDYSLLLTKAIGSSEILVAIWVLTRIKPKFSAAFQILIIATMNILEFSLVPELLLWGKLNALFAFLFIVLIFYYEFILHKNEERMQ